MSQYLGISRLVQRLSDAESATFQAATASSLDAFRTARTAAGEARGTDQFTVLKDMAQGARDAAAAAVAAARAAIMAGRSAARDPNFPPPGPAPRDGRGGRMTWDPRSRSWVDTSGGSNVTRIP